MQNLKRVTAKVAKMKSLTKKIVNSVISLAKLNVKNDINSTGSPWSYQPRIPESAEVYKK